jgi:predicted HTH domain antitoxin
MTIVIPDEILRINNLTAEQMTIDFATSLYAQERVTLAQGAKIAGLHIIDFQKALATRDIYIHFDMQDLEKDLKNLNLL